MAISAHFEMQKINPAKKRREPRRILLLDTQGSFESVGSANVLMHNISATGLLLECSVELAIDEQIDIELPHIGTTTAKVIWASDTLYGCEFASPISNAALSAASLRSAVGKGLNGHRQETAPASEPISSRLQRLRKQRGLSMSEVAAKLGVSKPTIWAWEQGRSRPVESRIGALADALGVSQSELVATLGGPLEKSRLSQCKEHVAEVFGISPDSVRIMIDL